MLVAVMIVVRLARLVLSAGMSWVWDDSSLTRDASVGESAPVMFV